MDNHPKIGQLADPSAPRDAVHVAVIPCQAGEELSPGQSVGILAGKAVPGGDTGVVDPFLTQLVRVDDWFWLFLPPGKVTGVRHDWDHPDFPPAKTVSAPPARMQKAIERVKEMAEMDDPFCCGHEAVDFMYRILSDLKGKG